MTHVVISVKSYDAVTLSLTRAHARTSTFSQGSSSLSALVNRCCSMRPLAMPRGPESEPYDCEDVVRSVDCITGF